MANIYFVNMTEDDFLKKGRSSVVPSLYKYMPLEYGLKTLDDGQLWFANPILWTDPFESRFVRALYPNNQPFPWKNRVFCTCFTTKASSEAHWLIHARKEIGIKLSLDREKFVMLLRTLPNDWNIYIGKVEYMKTSNIESLSINEIPFKEPMPSINDINNLCARLLMLKRTAFRYENEIRVVIVQGETLQNNIEGIYIPLHCEYSSPMIMTDIVKSISFSPLMGEKTRLVVRKYLKTKFKDIIIKRSTLYDKSKNEINLTW